jgi:hypothetical protein
LDLHRALHRIHGGDEFGKGTITGILENAPVELRRGGIKDLGPQCLQSSKGPRLVRRHHPRIGHHIGRKDRGQASLQAFFRHVA